eukprot:10527776-Karenia_brevis.AAC.1
MLKKTFIVKCRGKLGRSSDCIREIRALNRVLRDVPACGTEPECMEYEGDQRHIEILEKQLGFRDNSNA